MRVVKSISLPVDLAIEAEKIPNLSKFVQDCIRMGVKEERLSLDRLSEARGRRIEIMEKQIRELIALAKPRSQLHKYPRILKYVEKSDDWFMNQILEELK